MVVVTVANNYFPYSFTTMTNFLLVLLNNCRWEGMSGGVHFAQRFIVQTQTPSQLQVHVRTEGYVGCKCMISFFFFFNHKTPNDPKMRTNPKV